MSIPPLPESDFEVDIGPEEIAFYRENGYLAVERIMDDAELAWLRETYDILLGAKPTGLLNGIFDLANRYGTTDTPKLGQLLRPEAQAPQILETRMWKNARQISAKLLDVPLDDVSSWGHLIFKGRLSPEVTPWHQDEAYWDMTKTYNALGSWLAVDKVDTDNGCLWFVPGSHESEVLPHKHKNDDPYIHVLQFRDAPDVSKGVPVPLEAGGMTFHHARTWHYAGPNRTDRLRRAWANEFQTVPVQRTDTVERPWLTEGYKALEDSYARAR
ncbi:MAG: phytanoyl-CoA dioxygenase family protein [Alphaproteobacteria bacterium]|nr:phytanoyl-CoA dioxygenase family protein [Alphaproteobacteria bacterium]